MTQLDLDTCDREPIHIPGSIQSHGVLLAYDPESHEISHASKNAETLFKTPLNRIVGARIDALLGPKTAVALAAPNADRGDTAAPNRSFGLKIGALKGRFNSASHMYAGRAILELEPAAESAANAPLDIVKGLLAKLQQTKTLQYMCSETAQLLRDLIGFDRVMIYRFLSDGAGQVIAESRTPDLESLLHLRYPASDIPKQARELYKRSWVRLVSDVAAPTSPIVTTKDISAPLDLSYAELRSVSPVHIEYLRNMGVAASMSISIVVAGELWGLIACHHRTKRHVTTDIRAAAELLGQVFSLQIQAIEGAEAYVTMRAARALLDRVVAEFPVDGDLAANLGAKLDQLCSFVVSDGAGIWIDGSFRGIGRTPTEDQVKQLAHFVDQHREAGVFATSCLPVAYPPSAGWKCGAKGVLAIPLSYSDANYLFFFRREVLQTIEWGGNPNKSISVGSSDRISPRKSFDAWKEEVKGQSSPWSARDRLIGETLRVYLSDIIMRFSDVIREERRQAEQRNRLIVNELNHRVKGTLELIQSLVVHGYDEPGKVREFVRALEGRIKAIALAHDATSVSHGAEVGTLIERALALHSVPSRQIEIEGPDLRLDAKSFTVLALVVHELIMHTVEAGVFEDPHGRLTVNWFIDRNGGLALNWQEFGGQRQLEVRDKLSLAIIRRNIPHALGGEAEVHLHDSGLKAAFKIPQRYLVEVPQPKTVSQDASPRMTGPTRTLEGVSVLVVEDHVPVAFDLEQILYEHGAAAVKIVATTLEALVEIERDPPDVAVVDVDLDGETSMPIAEALTEKSIPFVFTAGQGDLDLIPQKFREIDVQLKPLSGDSIVRLLKDALLPYLIRAVLSRIVE